ncbi:protein of unknown function [Pseudodesulfovibrio profundus]|uniref:Uncharacterized protein n=1 Tax=Pseudodesulfovibrio profundus TaxID=57320 RepID=A0A2C8FDH5_9BACT|nr:protein of unknown function [Pseudodesulfovibrio profundus]
MKLQHDVRRLLYTAETSDCEYKPPNRIKPRLQRNKEYTMTKKSKKNSKRLKAKARSGLGSSDH